MSFQGIMRALHGVTYHSHTECISPGRDPSELKGKVTEIYTKTFEDECSKSDKLLDDLEGGIERVKEERRSIKKDGFGTKLLCGLRSCALVALYALGILTILPALGAGVYLLASDQTIRDLKIFNVNVGYRFISMKSPAYIAVEDRWNALRTQADERKNPTKIRVEFIENSGENSYERLVQTKTSYYDLSDAISHLDGRELEEAKDRITRVNADFTSRMQRIQEVLSQPI